MVARGKIALFGYMLFLVYFPIFVQYASEVVLLTRREFTQYVYKYRSSHHRFIHTAPFVFRGGGGGGFVCSFGLLLPVFKHVLKPNVVLCM